MAESVIIPSGEGFDLEGILEGEGGRGAVLCHPHPAFGGTLRVPLMGALARGLADAGWLALRFNFRGVGASGGQGAGGLVEQRDVRAACAFLRARGVRAIALVGYSFGGLMAAKAVGAGESVLAWVAIGFPTGIVGGHADRVAGVSEAMRRAPALLLSGSDDPLSDLESLRRWAGEPARARVVSLAGAGHLFVGEAALAVVRQTVNFLEEQVPRA